jgi:hypothetical protein
LTRFAAMRAQGLVKRPPTTKLHCSSGKNYRNL